VYWIHADTGEMIRQSDPFVYNGAAFSLNSYMGHKFQIRELAGAKTGICGDPEDGDLGVEGIKCRVNYFQVNANQDQVLFVTKGLEITHQDDKSVARDAAKEAMLECKQTAKNSITRSLSASSVEQTYANFITCVDKNVQQKLKEQHEEVEFQSNLRKTMGDMIENYVCDDDELKDPEPVGDNYKTFRGNRVGVLFERDTSQIHLLHGFVSSEECAVLEKEVTGRLTRVGPDTEEGLKGLKGWQATIEPGEGGRTVTSIVRRIYDYANTVVNFGLKMDGQEGLTAVQLTPSTDGGETPDRYLPHCDGTCDGLKHTTGGKVSTMVIYCKSAEKGGAVNFRNAGLHFKPKEGDAVFYSYASHDETMDKGFTENSVCPLREGDTLFFQHSIRLGVDNNNPWTAFSK